MSLPDAPNIYVDLAEMPKSSVKARADTFLVAERKRNLTRLFGTNRTVFQKVTQSLGKIGPQELGARLLALIDSIHIQFRDLSPAKAELLVRDLEEMRSLILDVEYDCRELVLQTLFFEPKSEILKQLVGMDLAKFGEAVRATLGLLMELCTASAALVNRFWDPELLKGLAFLVEKANPEIAGGALLCLGNLVTQNPEVREGIQKSGLLEPLTDCFRNDVGQLADNSPPQTVELVMQYFYFFGGVFAQRPYLPIETMLPYVRPFLVALCQYDKLFEPYLFYIVEFFNTLTVKINQEAFMEQLEPFAPAFGRVLVHHMDSPVEELRRKVVTLIANVTQFEDTQLLKVFEGTDIVPKTIALLATSSPQHIDRIANYCNNFVYDLTQPVSIEFLGAFGVWEGLRTKLAAGHFEDDTPLLEAFNSYLRHVDEPAVQEFIFVNYELFKESMQRMHNSRGHYILFILMQIYDNIVRIGWRLKDAGRAGDNAFLRVASSDNEFLSSLQLISEHHPNEEVRRQAVDMIEECREYLEANPG